MTYYEKQPNSKIKVLINTTKVKSLPYKKGMMQKI